MSQPVLLDDEPIASQSDRIGMLGIILLALLIAGAILNYLDRLAISTLAPVLKQTFHLNNQDWGLANAAFNFVYIFTSFFGGAWVDRVGVRKGLLIGAIVWGCAAIGHAFATGFWSLCFWRAMLALGEGPGAAAMVKGARRLMPPRLRDTGNGLINAGWAAGALIAPLIVGAVAIRYGWRGAFYVTGGLCFLWIPLWLVFSWGRSTILGPQRVHLITASDEPPHRLDVRSYALWGTLAAIFFTVPATAFVNTFLPVFLHDGRGVPQAQIPHLYWQPFLATDIGQILGGLIVYALLRQGWRFLNARRLVMIAGFIGAGCMLGVNYLPDAHRALYCIDLSRFFFQVGYTVLVAYGIESVAENQTALMAGVMNATFSACNFIFNPLIGRIADRHGFSPVIVMIAWMPLLGLACWIVLSEMHARQKRLSPSPGTPGEGTGARSFNGAYRGTLGSSTKGANMPSTEEDLKKALKAFKKRLKLTRLDGDSKIGHGPLSGTGKEQVVSIQPPLGFGKEIWEELADKGFLKRDTVGFYELVEGK